MTIRCKPIKLGFIHCYSEKMGVKCSSCIVVDDNRIFLRVVKKAGAKTILFRNASSMKSSLKKFGINT